MKLFFLSFLLIISFSSFAQNGDLGFDKVLFSVGLSNLSDNNLFEQDLSYNDIYKVSNLAYSFDLSIPIYHITDEMSAVLNGFYDIGGVNTNIKIQSYGLGCGMDYVLVNSDKYELMLSIGGGYLFHGFELYDVDKIEGSKIDSNILGNNSQIDFKQSFIAYSTFGAYNEYHFNNKLSLFGLIKIRWDYGKSDKYLIDNREITLYPYSLNKLYLGLGLKFIIF